MTKTHSFIPPSRAARRLARRRRAFTVLEMLVALAVFAVLLAAVFVPIKLAGDLSGVGTARANAQQAAVEGIRQMRNDIQRAIVILPNDRTAGITDAYPYVGITGNIQNPGNNGFPYRRNPLGYVVPATKDAQGTANLDACSTTGTNAYVPAPNTSRLDLILPADSITTATPTPGPGRLDPKVRPNNVLVSYYARRLDISRAFDPITNPVVLFRAQVPFQYINSSTGVQPFPAWTDSSSPNADLSDQRFDNTNAHPCNSRGLQWLTMNQYGEFNLAPLALPPAGYTPTTTSNSDQKTFSSNQLVLPRDTALITPNAATDTGDNPNPTMSLVPDTTFICSDTNKDGKIDTVTIQLSVGQYDENSVNRRTIPTPTGTPSGTPAPHAQLVPQTSRTLTETVFDPNVQ